MLYLSSFYLVPEWMHIPVKWLMVTGQGKLWETLFFKPKSLFLSEKHCRSISVFWSVNSVSRPTFWYRFWYRTEANIEWLWHYRQHVAIHIPLLRNSMSRWETLFFTQNLVFHLIIKFSFLNPLFLTVFLSWQTGLSWSKTVFLEVYPFCLP